jgi:hypothetical protein
MKKLLYIAPHLSTGGLPQYLTKKIELLKDEFEIYLIEWADVTGGRLVVTKNKILKLVKPNRFFTLGENKMELMDIVNRIQPDIVHNEEIPEFYMDFDDEEFVQNNGGRVNVYCGTDSNEDLYIKFRTRKDAVIYSLRNL